MRLSALLGRPVVDGDGRRWGTVHDARLVQDGPLLASGSAAFRLHGLVAGPGSLGTRLGYADRGGDEAKGPLPLRLAVRWLHRRAVYVPWGAVRSVEADRIVVEAPPGGFEPVRTPR